MYAAQPLYGQQYPVPPNPFPYHYALPFYPPSSHYNPHFYPHYGAPPPQTSTPASPMSSPHAAMRLNIPLADFCSHYGISESDQAKLDLMEYKPGNRAVETLEENEWKAEFKFTRLGWRAFLDVHRTFLKDVKNGNWVTV
jgi:hypothetical protein